MLDQLSLLVDKSLVLVDDSGDQARYRLLETIRDYAAARLAATDEETAAAPAIATTTWPSPRRPKSHLEGPGQTEWMARVAADYPNLRAALAWSRLRGEHEQLARMAAALHLYWMIHGPNTDGAAWLDFVLERRSLPVAGAAGQGLARSSRGSFVQLRRCLPSVSGHRRASSWPDSWVTIA